MDDSTFGVGSESRLTEWHHRLTRAADCRCFAVCRLVVRVAALAETLGISQPNATYKVNNLAAKGYVNRHTPEDDRRERRRVEFYPSGVCFSYGEERGRENLLRQEPYPEELSRLNEGGVVCHAIPSATFFHAWSQSGELPDGFQGMFGAFF